APRLRARYRILRRGSHLAAEKLSAVLRSARALDRILAVDLDALREARAARLRVEAARARNEVARKEALALAEAARLRRQGAESARAALPATHDGLRRARPPAERLAPELRPANRRPGRALG